MFKRSYKAPYLRVVLRARSWRRVPMKFLKWSRKMPSKNQYNLVPNDEYDPRIPLHSDEAFQYGLNFQAKYIGSMDVPRPTNRVEIVAAMRRVRYEYKAKGVKKRKVTVEVSMHGVQVTYKKKTNKSKKSSKLFGRRNKNDTEEATLLMQHPIYRIFYVSHDSSDLKIFSYIARDGATNAFRCNVFKSTRKSQAMRIVRTVGQAFEVCHKMQKAATDQYQPVASTSSAVDDQPFTDRPSEVPPSKEAASDCGASGSGAASTSKVPADEVAVKSDDQTRPKTLELLPPPPRKDKKRIIQRPLPTPSIQLPDLPECVTKVDVASNQEGDVATPLSAQHQLQLLRERLQQQAQQTRAAVAQLQLLRDQLSAEQSARCEAQARTHQLLVHNKELLEHIAALVDHLQERERGSTRPISAQQLTLLPQNDVETSVNNGIKVENARYNGNRDEHHADSLIDLITYRNKVTRNAENDNIRLSPLCAPPNIPGTPLIGPSSAPSFGGMTNDQIQNYLINKFQTKALVNGTNEPPAPTVHKQFYQNTNAFPGIPPLSNHFSNTDLASLMNHQAYKENIGSKEFIAPQPMSIGQSENSLCSNSQATTSKDSTPDPFSSDDADEASFIMPLSHNGTLTTTSDDGRVKLIVPVSPSGSSSDVVTLQTENQQTSGTTLKVPGADFLLTPSGPITRTTSEKVPNRSEMMTALRSQWTRHTTK